MAEYTAHLNIPCIGLMKADSCQGVLLVLLVGLHRSPLGRPADPLAGIHGFAAHLVIQCHLCSTAFRKVEKRHALNVSNLLDWAGGSIHRDSQYSMDVFRLVEVLRAIES